MSRERRDTCRDCARTAYIKGRGLCAACYARHANRDTLDQFPVMMESRRDEVLRLIRQGHTQVEVSDRLGMSRNAVQQVVARAKRAGLTEPAADILPSTWPDEPSPCKGQSLDDFLLEGNKGGNMTRAEVAKALDALSYCDRCPLATRQWCLDVVKPQQSRFSGVAGAVAWLSGHPRIIGLPDEVRAERVAS